MRADRFIPSPGHLLVKVDEGIMKDQSRIIVPDTVRRDGCSKFAIVMAVGDMGESTTIIRAGANLATTTKWKLEVGDSVLFHIHESIQVKLDGEEFYVIEEDAVLGKINLD